ncbi:probable tRNA (uracil-O(2)-)-methyltransferase [Neolamprologus brichardi]|uniref:probable tRNA (uracil-O(2)-)-methyltransferase n=1 Tax=Neolamprologus brichardi TaxID=32507 RepID=UPI001643C033|nr:probable tRNA (uracil-O(2)-)-methyltransferase [Neolamprologus brichardi]
MPKLFNIKFPGGCKSLPDGFWSAVDVWIKKPHVVNKRLCGVKETDSKDVDQDDLRLLLHDPELFTDVLLFVITGASAAHEADKPWSSSVRTFIPKVNCYGTNLHKEIILKDFGRQRVTFIPFEEDAEGKASLKKGNIYQIQLCNQDCRNISETADLLAFLEFTGNGVEKEKISNELQLCFFLPEVRFRSTLSLLPVEKYSLMYQQLKDKYKAMVKVWPEVTDPEKFVYEDVAIATYLLVLWAEERAERGLTARQSFVDLGCGNGLLVHILTNEGEKAITPSESFLFLGTDWLIGNHSDELTPWIPVIAARSSYSCRYFVLPCCFFDFCGKYQRRQCKKSQYKEYVDFIAEVSQVCGFNTDEDCLRIPSTKRVCLLGKSRNYQLSDEPELEQQRAHYIHSRCTAPGVTVQRSDVSNDEDCCIGNGSCNGTPGSSWGAGFQPRDRVEAVRNCAALPRDFVDGVVLRVANTLLGMTAGDGEGSCCDWNQGGKTIDMSRC